MVPRGFSWFPVMPPTVWTDVKGYSVHPACQARCNPFREDQNPVEASVARDIKQTVDSYVTDMLALEDHIEKAIRSQVEGLKEHPDVAAELREIHRMVERHISDLKALSDGRDAGGVAEAIKRAGSAVLGAAAGVIDSVRTEGLPKDLRDDYAALSLASIGYVMLHTTALSLGAAEVAQLAHQGFSDYAGAVSRVQSLIPAAVVTQLEEEGLPARADVVTQVRRTIEEVWQSQSTGAGVAGGRAVL